MARSEIDDIFAEKKSTAKVITQPVAPTSISADTAGSKKKKKRKKREVSAEEAQDPGADEERPRKKRVVETILDPSTSAPLVPSSKVSQVGKGVRTTRPRGSKEQKEDLDRFIDSRGTGPRRKTEEGFSVYKESELGINPEAGGTPLCPFDCDCCF